MPSLTLDTGEVLCECLTCQAKADPKRLQAGPEAVEIAKQTSAVLSVVEPALSKLSDYLTSLQIVHHRHCPNTKIVDSGYHYLVAGVNELRRAMKELSR